MVVIYNLFPQLKYSIYFLHSGSSQHLVSSGTVNCELSLHVSCVMAIWHWSPSNWRWVLKSRSGCNYVRQIVILCRWEEVLWNTFGLLPTVTSARVVVAAGCVMIVVVHNRVEVGSVVLRARSPGRKVAWKNSRSLTRFSNAVFSILLNFGAVSIRC